MKPALPIRRQSPWRPLALILALALGCPVAGSAAAVDSEPRSRVVPITDGLDGATPLRTAVPPPPALADPQPEPEEVTPEPEEVAPGAPEGPEALTSEPPVADEPSAPLDPEDRDRTSLFVHGRWIHIPAFVFDLFYSDSQPLHQPSVAIGLETGETNGEMWAFELGWMPLIPRPGNWLSRGSPPSDANYVESRLHMLTLDATFRRQFEIARIFRVFVGAGLGLALIVGDATTDEVLPDCEAPVSACGHWPRATRSALDLPSRILPVLHLTAGMELDLGEAMSLRISGGLRNIPYVGLSLGLTL